MIIKLTGKTQKGKNRVREYGSLWKVHRQIDNVIFSDNIGPWGFITPVVDDSQKPLYSRWIHLKYDIDFNIEEPD